MTDNTTASAPIGIGDTFATKDIAGIKYPRNILTTPAGSDITPLSEGGTVSVTGTVTTTATVANFPASQAVTGTFWQATQPVSIAGTVAVSNAALPLPAGASTETTLAAVNTKLAGTITTTALTDTQLRASAVPVSLASTTVTGNVAITAAALPLPAGAATEATLAARIPANGQALMAASMPVTIASNQSTLAVNNVPNTATGTSVYHHLISAATTNATSVKASGALLNAIVISNASAAVKFFKLYNKASAPTLGTDVPVLTILVPAGQTVSVPTGPFGMRLTTGLAYATTALITDADTTAVGLSDLAINLNYL